MYHDKDDKKYTICTVKWHATGRKETGKNEGKVMPTHSKIISDEKVSEGQTTRRVIYENGDVAEYGYNKGIYFWNLYKITER
ncbi:hypothetical protein [Empedobacter tilapiae]|uniref:hypothetical protein n=1 Tax=Empedobacter tilapiae TaxID=2491114 RepID=UPI0028D1D08F|nr:hypothetical protein [Empedobacter tilapiae]